MSANKWAPANPNHNEREKREEVRPKAHIEFDDDELRPKREPDTSTRPKREPDTRPRKEFNNQRRPNDNSIIKQEVKQEVFQEVKQEPLVYQSTFQQMPQLPHPKKRILLKKKEPVINIKEEKSVVLEEA